MAELTDPARAIEREQVEYVFGLTGGELDDKPVTFVAGFREQHGKIEETDLGLTWLYHYDSVPEWAYEDFDRDVRSSASGDYFTLVDLGCEYGSRENKILIDSDGRIYLHVKTYANSGETECPGQHEDEDKVSAEHTMGGNVCVLCEAALGEEHGYIYIGPGAEHVYKFVGYIRTAGEQCDECAQGIPDIDDSDAYHTRSCPLVNDTCEKCGKVVKGLSGVNEVLCMECALQEVTFEG